MQKTQCALNRSDFFSATNQRKGFGLLGPHLMAQAKDLCILRLADKGLQLYVQNPYTNSGFIGYTGVNNLGEHL